MWPNRDPYGELGAETIALLKTPQRNLLLPIFVRTMNTQNLYEFVGNDAIDRDDPYGLVFMPPRNPKKGSTHRSVRSGHKYVTKMN